MDRVKSQIATINKYKHNSTKSWQTNKDQSKSSKNIKLWTLFEQGGTQKKK